MNLLVINTGSASVKFAVFDFSRAAPAIFRGVFEHFHADGCTLNYYLSGEHQAPRQYPARGVEDALKEVTQLLQEFNLLPLTAVGHRVAHGGEKFTQSIKINDEVLAHMEACTPLAPLHNPANLSAVKQAKNLWPSIPQFAVFDTAFHHTIPASHYTYAIPQKWRDKGFRRYGFHGTSHQFVAQQVAWAMDLPLKHLRIVSCHLGSGASLCAIERGVSVDTSMGMTPLEGLVMNTRSGDVDPGLFAWLQRNEGLSSEEVEKILYTQSGLLALTGTQDMREIEKRALRGDKYANLAIEIYVHRIRKTIGAYVAAMGGVDAVTFTGGVGENSTYIRERICEKFSFLGLQLDHKKNAAAMLSNKTTIAIDKDYASVKLFVIRCDEQLMIAKEVQHLLSME